MRLGAIRRRVPIDLATAKARLAPQLVDPIQEFIAKFELPRHHFKPLDAFDFDRDSSLAITANMVYTTIVSYTIPPMMEGVLKFVGQEASDPQIFDDCTWKLIMNGTPVPEWGSVQFQRGSLRQPFPVTIFLQPGCIIALQIQNNTANTYTGAFGRLAGWYWLNPLLATI